MEPKPEGGSGVPGSKRVAAKAVKASAAKSVFPNADKNGNVPQAKQSKTTPRSSTDFDLTTSSASESTPAVAPVKTAAGINSSRLSRSFIICIHCFFAFFLFLPINSSQDSCKS